MFSRQSKTMRVPLRAGPLALTAILTLGGCTVGPRFEAPQAQTPPTWNDPSAGSAAAAAEVDPRWWRAYGDPVLDSLMERALAGNLSAGGAVSRIAESRARERAAAAAGLPSVKAGGGVTRE